MWRFTQSYEPRSDYPIRIHEQFLHLPKYIRSIDAAYERDDGLIFLFHGNIDWTYPAHLEELWKVNNSSRCTGHLIRHLN